MKRSVFSALFPTALAALLLFTCSTRLLMAAENDSPTKTVLILGDKEDEIPSLRLMLAEHGYDVAQAAQKTLDVDLDEFDAVIMYVHQVIQPDVEKALIDYTQGGGRMLVVHHGIASAKVNNPAWMKMLGVEILPRDHETHPWHVASPVTHTMVNVAPKHFITTRDVEYAREVDYQSPDREDLKGRFQAIDLPDTEVFEHQRHTDGDAKTILFGYRLVHPETGAVTMEDTSGWCKPVGEGLLLYLQAGHAEHDFRDPQFARIIRNCLDWKQGKE